MEDNASNTREEKNKNFFIQIEQIKKMYPQLCEKDSEKYIDLLIHISQKTGLDILQKQIYAVIRNTKTIDGRYEKTCTIQTSIDGFRIIAERTGKYAPGKESLISFDENRNIISATSYVKKMTDDKTWHEVAVTAYYDEYVQRSKDGKPTRFWMQMPKLMLSKCAESLALRKAFPNVLSGIYTDDEMSQADKSTDEKEEFEVSDKIPEVHANEIKKLLNGDKEIAKEFFTEFKIAKITDLKRDYYRKAINWLKEEASHDIQKAQ